MERQDRELERAIDETLVSPKQMTSGGRAGKEYKCSDCKTIKQNCKKCCYCGEMICPNCFSAHWNYRSTCTNCED